MRQLCSQYYRELNWIERFWGASKMYCRTHCLYTIAGLRETVPISLSQDLSDIPQHLKESEDFPVANIFEQRRWARISRQYMREYRKGINACAAVQAVA